MFAHTSFNRHSREFARWLVSTVLIFAGMVSPALAINSTPAGGYIFFDLQAGESSLPITLPANIPVVVTGAQARAGYRGVAQISVLYIPGSFLEWSGLSSPSGAAVVSGFSGTAGTVMTYIDYNHLVSLSVNSPDTFVVTNNNFVEETGYVSWSYADTNTAQNVALGEDTLPAVTTGDDNTGVGYQALHATTSGSSNTAVGNQALWADISGQQNMAVGRNALHNNTTGSYNSAMGYSACWSCITGSNNVAYGVKSLYHLGSGGSNTAIGSMAGYNILESNNVDIANEGVDTDSGVIRIGASEQTATFIAGISNTPMTGSQVVINSSGQLGVLASSERFKEQISLMTADSGRLAQLRPVTFHLKSEPAGEVQYGLIAEEVDRVYPALVIRDQKGLVQGVRYDELAPILLKELKSQMSELQSQQAMSRRLEKNQQDILDQVAQLKYQNTALQAEVRDLTDAAGRVARR